jgi:hypothetical protein
VMRKARIRVLPPLFELDHCLKNHYFPNKALAAGGFVPAFFRIAFVPQDIPSFLLA